MFDFDGLGGRIATLSARLSDTWAAQLTTLATRLSAAWAAKLDGLYTALINRAPSLDNCDVATSTRAPADSPLLANAAAGGLGSASFGDFHNRPVMEGVVGFTVQYIVSTDGWKQVLVAPAGTVLEFVAAVCASATLELRITIGADVVYDVTASTWLVPVGLVATAAYYNAGIGYYPIPILSALPCSAPVVVEARRTTGSGVANIYIKHRQT